MRNGNRLFLAGVSMMLIGGCVVREEPRPRRVYVEPAYAPAPPPPVVVEEGPPPGYVEYDVGPAPGPDYVIVASHWEFRDGHRAYIHRYWRHR